MASQSKYEWRLTGSQIWKLRFADRNNIKNSEHRCCARRANHSSCCQQDATQSCCAEATEESTRPDFAIMGATRISRDIKRGATPPPPPPSAAPLDVARRATSPGTVPPVLGAKVLVEADREPVHQHPADGADEGGARRCESTALSRPPVLEETKEETHHVLHRQLTAVPTCGEAALRAAALPRLPPR